MLRLLAAALLAASAFVPDARAGIILQDSANGSAFFVASIYRDFGQSFTADASVANLSSVGFFFQDGNTFLPNPTVSATLYAGSGYSGPSLGTETLTIDGSLGSRFVDFSFAGTALTPGESYSFRVQASRGRGGFQYYTDFAAGEIYPGGSIYFDTTASPDTDLRFRVLGSTAEPAAIATPEPGAAVLAASGLPVVLGFWLKRRRKAKAAA